MLQLALGALRKSPLGVSMCFDTSSTLRNEWPCVFIVESIARHRERGDRFRQYIVAFKVENGKLLHHGILSSAALLRMNRHVPAHATAYN